MTYTTGIMENPLDKSQPFRVWYNGNIIWFAHTMKEAEEKLEKERRRKCQIVNVLSAVKRG